MKKIINVTICIFSLFSIKAFSQDISEKDFFCCSVNDIYKTSTDINKYEDSIENKESSKFTRDLINIEADETFRDESKQITILQGDTKIVRGSETIQSELANVLQLEDRARMSGNVRYENEGLEITSPYAEYDTRSSRTDFLSPKYKYPELEISGKAHYGVRLKNKKVFLKNSTYTTCDLLNPDWNLIGSSTELDFENGIGKSRDVFVTIKGVPVFYSPYMQFSLDDQRKTGFLVPDFSGSWVKGPDVITPFYWSIAPNMDMLIRPGYIQERGSKLESTYRYLNQNSVGTFYFSFLDDDSEYKGSGKNTRDNSDRYNFYFKHEHTFANNLKINLLYDKFSDKDYFDDFGSGISDSSTSYRTRHAKLEYDFNGWSIRSRFMGYQTFDRNLNSSSQPYDILPEVNIHKRVGQSFLNYDLNINIAKWDHISKVDGTRADMQIGIDKTFFAKGISVKPRFKLQHTTYDLDKQSAGLTSSPSKTIPIFSIDNEMTLSKQVNNSGLVHQIKPRIFYLYSGEEDQSDIPIFDTGVNEFTYSQLFRDNSFSGYDRNNDTNQLTLSLSSGFYSIEESRELFSASIGQIFYFEDRKVSLDNSSISRRANSNIVAELEYKPFLNTSFRSTFMYDRKAISQKTQKNIHTFQYKGKGNNVINASYRYRKNDIEQGDLSFAWGLSDRLNILGRWNYDFKNDLSANNSGDIETLAGLEYESCCWKARLVHRRFKIDENSFEKDIQFQIMLKGFTDVGTPLGDLISNSIKGYIDKEY